MPTYDYHCAANDRTVEVTHRMTQELKTWGELCALANIEAGATPSNSPITKVHLGTGRVSHENLGSNSRGGSAFGAGTTTKAYHKTKNFEARE
jgi:hypothetical protein